VVWTVLDLVRSYAVCVCVCVLCALSWLGLMGWGRHFGCIIGIPTSKSNTVYLNTGDSHT
jgi:hypothetical protein